MSVVFSTRPLPPHTVHAFLSSPMMVFSLPVPPQLRQISIFVNWYCRSFSIVVIV
jgi:hypothetical protein